MARKEEFNLGFRPKDYGTGRDSVIASIALPRTVSDVIQVRARMNGGTYRYTYRITSLKACLKKTW